jgi:hypothetical protein
MQPERRLGKRFAGIPSCLLSRLKAVQANKKCLTYNSVSEPRTLAESAPHPMVAGKEGTEGTPAPFNAITV